MVVTRCDKCKELSDTQGVGHVGQEWELMNYKHRIMKITTSQDYCSKCIKELINGSSLQKYGDDY